MVEKDVYLLIYTAQQTRERKRKANKGYFASNELDMGNRMVQMTKEKDRERERDRKRERERRRRRRRQL